MSQDKRLILAVALSVVIFYVYQSFFAPPPPEKTTVTDTQTETVQNQKTVSATEISEEGSKSAIQVVSEGETVAEEKNILIETPVSTITISTRGGVLTSYELKKYFKEAKEDSENKNLLTETTGSQALFLGFKGYSAFTPSKVFELVKDETAATGVRTIVLEWKNNLVKINKTFVFDAGQKNYEVVVNYSVENLSSLDMPLTPYLENIIEQKPQLAKKSGILSFMQMERPDTYNSYYLNGKELTTFENWPEFSGGESSQGQVFWAGISDRYFLFALMPDAASSGYAGTTLDREGNKIINKFYNKEIVAAPHQQIQGSFVAYIGPKNLDDMQAVNPLLKRSVDYGWFSVLAFPLLWLMGFFHKFIPSWGLVIIALTFVVKILLHPINHKAMTSMKDMQKLQPKMQEIKKKYPDDKAKQQEEVMQLFKTHKVNPMGGCLPLLLQFPVYIVLYRVLWNSIDLYHAPFMGIYADLSAPDPYYVSPVLLGVFMFLQQKLTPTASTDPVQQKMMMFMPIMFTVFMLFLPVGLVIYIFVNTVMSVVQQYMIKHDLHFKDFLKGKFRPQPGA